VKRPTRRDFLLASAAGLALSPFVPLLEAHGDTPTPPKRLILFYTPIGMAMEHWRPTGGETDFTLSKILKPLAAHKNEMIVLEGLYNSGARLSQWSEEGHAGGSSLFTGKVWEPEDPSTPKQCYWWPTGASIDQVVADASGKPPMNLGVLSTCSPGDVYCRHVFSRGYKDPVQAEMKPSKVFDQWFADFALPPDQLLRLKAERKSTIDFLKNDLASLRARVGKGDRDKLDAHLEAVLGLETKLGNVGVGCTLPTAPDGSVDVSANDNLPWVTERQLDIALQALACDLTRVVGFQWGKEGSSGVATWLGIGGGLHTNSHDTSAAAILNMAEFQSWLAGELASLLDRLKTTSDADGNPLMDNTLVVWGTAIAEGWTHSIYNIPHTIFAGKNIGWSTNRYLKWGDYADDRYPWDEKNQMSGQPNNRLLCSIGRAMGLDMESFGDTTRGGGPLDGLIV